MKIDRLIGILSVLLQKDKVTTGELAEMFEVSKRTINRDVESLLLAGIPLYTSPGVNGGIQIMDGYRVDRTILSGKEMQAILAGLKSLDSISGNHLCAADGKALLRKYGYPDRQPAYPDRPRRLSQNRYTGEN